MAEQHPQMRPVSPAQAPDTARVYERAQPAKEAGMGRLDNKNSVPAQGDDKMEHAVKNRQANRQINAEDVVNQRAGHAAQGTAIPQPDHSMHDEEPLGWDQAPTDIKNPRDQRQPKTDGKGGTP
jgi:hypothetical protein